MGGPLWTHCKHNYLSPLRISDAREGEANLEPDVLIVSRCIELTLSSTLEMVRQMFGFVGLDMPSPER